MTDYEMLETAAQAAGIQLADDVDSRIPSGGLWILGRMGRDEVWNPLEDDGDAFRLMVDLGISPEIHLADKHVLTDNCYQSAGWPEHNGCLRSATRRAIVRDAAAMEAS